MRGRSNKSAAGDTFESMFLCLESRRYLSATDAAIDLRALDQQASEGGSPGAAVVELVRLGGDVSRNIPVRIGTSGDARLGPRGDFEFYVNGNRINGAVVEMPAGITRVVVELRAIDDGLAELDETAMLTVLPGRGYFKARAHVPVEITIVDNEPVVSLSTPDALANESGDRGRWVLSRSGSLQQPLTIQTRFGGAARISGSSADFEILLSAGLLSRSNSELTFPIGVSTITITAVPLNDGTVEGPEATDLTVRSSTGYRVQGIASGRITIGDDEPSLRIEGGGQSVVEGGGSIFLTVVRTGNLNQEMPVTLRFSGTARNGGATPDVRIRVLEFPYLGSTGSFIMPAGFARAVVEISALDDLVAEQLEQFDVTIQPGRDFWLSSSTASMARVSVIDNEPAIAIVSPSGAPLEGTTAGSFVIQRNGSFDRQLIVGLQWGGTARFGIPGDYTISASGGELSPDGRSLIMPAGTDQVELTITSLTDFLNEGSESIQLTILPRTEYSVPDDRAGRTATLDIIDSGTYIQYGPADSRVEEAGGVRRFVLIRSGQVDSVLTIPLIWGGTASRSGANADVRMSISGASWDSSQRRLTFAAGQTRAEISVEAIEDRLVEPDETVTLAINSTREYGVSRIPGGGPAKITVVDNEPTYSISSPERFAGESFTNQNSFTGRFVLTRTNSAQPQSLRLKLSGAAQYAVGEVTGGDYFLRLNGQNITGSNNVMIPAGQSELILEVVPIDDNLAERFEDVKIELLPSSEYRVEPSRKSASTLIVDNEPRVELTSLSLRGSISEKALLQENERHSVFVTRRLPQEGYLFTSTDPANLRVGLSVLGQATAGMDYRLDWMIGNQRFTLGDGRLFEVDLREQSFVQLDFTAKNDRIVEDVESILLSLDLTLAQKNDGDYTVLFVTNVLCNEPFVTVRWDTFPDSAFGEDSFIRRKRFIFESRARYVGADVDRVVVNFAMSGEAQQGSDYRLREFVTLDGSGELVTPTSILIESGIISMSAYLDVEAIDDSEAERDEDVVITLLGPTGESPNDYTIDDPLFRRFTSFGILRDNDLLEITSITSSGSVSESGGQPARITIERSDRNLSQEALVPVTISGTASRFTLTSLGASVPVGQSFIRIPAGQRTVTVDVVPVDDSAVNGTANVSLSVRAQPGVRLALGVPSTARVSITDDDRRAPTGQAVWSVFLASSVVLREFSGRYFELTISSGTLPARATTIELRVSGTAVEGTHVSAIPRTVTVPVTPVPGVPGLSSGLVTIRIEVFTQIDTNRAITIEVVRRSGMFIPPGQGTVTVTGI